MARLYVEGWAPEYGAPVETDDLLTPAEGSIDISVEGRPWEPVTGRDDGTPVIAFVDGVRRIDGRLTLDDPETGPIPGVCASYAVGAVLWDRGARVAAYEAIRVERIAVLSGGRRATLPPLPPPLTYRAETVADPDPAALIRAVHGAMRRSEAEIADRLGSAGRVVVADGPLYETAVRSDTIGYIKSHRVSYLPGEPGRLLGQLGPGERTPLFTIKGYERYSWYQRLAGRAGGHAWSGLVRCEAPAALAVEEAVRVADRSAAVLPAVGSEPHRDPRAPQNLVPIGALERELRHRLGEPGFVLRELRRAVTERGAAA
jgi:hypothetical protein